MGIFDNIPPWAMWVGGAIIGAVVVYLIVKFMKKERKEEHHHSKGEGEAGETSHQPRETSPLPHQGSTQPTLILLRWGKCGPCNAFLPIWKDLQGKYAGKINFEEHENEAEPEVMKQYQVTAFPTILARHSNGSLQKFDGMRTMEGLSKFIEGLEHPSEGGK